MAKPELRVSVLSEYFCPSCYTGSRRLLRRRDRFELRVTWCGLEVHPETPAAGMPVAKRGFASERWDRILAGVQPLARLEHAGAELAVAGGGQ